MGREYSTGIPQPSSKIVKRDKEGFVEFIHGEQEGGKGFREHRTDFVFQDVEIFPDIAGQSYIEQDLKRAPTEAEKSAMEEALKSFSDFFKNLPFKWSLEGGIIFSLLSGEFKRRHKDWDLEVEKWDLKTLDNYLAQKGYGLFIHRGQESGNKGKVLLEKIDHSAVEQAVEQDETGDLIIAAMNQNNQIVRTANPNYIDLIVTKRDKETNLPINNGLSLPEEWFIPKKINFKGCEINITSPLKAIYHKIHLNRPYDITDLLSLAETGQIALTDLAQMRDVLTKESEWKQQKLSECAERVARQVNDKSSIRDINRILQNDPLIAGRSSVEINQLCKTVAKGIKTSPDKSSQAILQIITLHYDVPASLAKQFKTIRQMEDIIKAKAIKDKINE